MTKSTKVRSVTVEISYPYPDTISDSFRVYLCKSSEGDWLKTLLIVSRGDANPIDYFADTYEGLNEFLLEEGIDINNLNIFVDLMECYGLTVPFLFKWNFVNSDVPLRSQLELVNIKQLSDCDRTVLQSFYKNKWSVFTESCLTNEDKVKLIASALANSIFDEFTMQSVQSSIGYKLDEAIKNKLRIDRLHEYTSAH